MLPNELVAFLDANKEKIIIIKFGATWCGPCKTIKPLVEQWTKVMAGNITFVDIDVDDSLELYMALKKVKMVSGLPTILAYYGDTVREQWYIPDDSVIGGNEVNIKSFLDRCASKANSLVPYAYTYYT
jgi:thiol-disulfide isomerase/thioredoxin